MLYHIENLNIQQVLNNYEKHLKNNEIVIKLQNAICRVFLDHETSKYQIMVDDVDINNKLFDIEVKQTAETFLGISR